MSMELKFYFLKFQWLFESNGYVLCGIGVWYVGFFSILNTNTHINEYNLGP